LAAEAPDLLAAYPGVIGVLRRAAEGAVKQTVHEARDLQVRQLQLIGRALWPDPADQIMPVDALLYGRRPGAAVCAEAGTLSVLVQRLRVEILGSRIPPGRPDLINRYLRSLESPFRLLAGTRWPSPQPECRAVSSLAPGLALFVFGEAGRVDFHGLEIQVFSSEQARTPVAACIVAATGHPPDPSSVREMAIRYVVREKYGPLLADDSQRGPGCPGSGGGPSRLIARILSSYQQTCSGDQAALRRAIERDVRFHSCGYAYGHSQFFRMAGVDRTALATALGGWPPREVRIAAALFELSLQSGPLSLVCFGDEGHDPSSIEQLVAMLVSDYWFSEDCWLRRKSELVLALLAPALAEATGKAAFQPRLEVLFRLQKTFIQYLDRVLALLRSTPIVAPDGYRHPAARIESVLEQWSRKEEEDLPPPAPALRAQRLFATWISWVKTHNPGFWNELLVDAGQLENQVKQTLIQAAGWHGAPDLGLMIEAALGG